MQKLCFTSCVFIICSAAAFAQYTVPSNLSAADAALNQYLSKSILKNKIEGNGKQSETSSYTNDENARGARFLFNTWVKGGSITTVKGTVINADNYLFNFDKMSGILLAKQENSDVMAVEPAAIKSFVLSNQGEQHHFKHVKLIDSIQFFLVLVADNAKYNLYKQIKTKFIKANFQSNGIVETGNLYDEYKDESQYFIVLPGNTSYRKISLKAKTIKDILQPEKEKVTAYLNQHQDDVISEDFLIGLITDINQ